MSSGGRQVSDLAATHMPSGEPIRLEPWGRQDEPLLTKLLGDPAILTGLSIW